MISTLDWKTGVVLTTLGDGVPNLTDMFPTWKEHYQPLKIMVFGNGQLSSRHGHLAASAK